MQERVFITGIGIVCAAGRNAAETLEALLAGRTGIGEITQFNTLLRGSVPIAEVKMTTAELLEITGHAGSRDFTRTALLGMKAAKEAMASAGISDPGDARTGLISATTVGGMDRSEQFYARFLEDPARGKLQDIVNHDCGDSTERIAVHLGIREFVTTISTACSSSVNALMTASNLIRSGQLDRVVAGGTDSVTRFTLNGFNTLMILDKSGCHPFDENRAGLTLGEGAAYLVLESESLVKRNGHKVLAEIKGYGNANDAYHQTASSPDGTGAFLAMSQALAMSGLGPGEIDYINVHGTGTQNNDLSEGIAMQRIFGEKVPPFSSTKGYTGHTLGAAGAVEAVISVLALLHQVRFPNPGFATPMKELLIKPISTGEFFAASPADPRLSLPVRNVLSNSFGFGGNNSTVILSLPFPEMITPDNSAPPAPVTRIPSSSRTEKRSGTPVYITGMGLVSPQPTVTGRNFPEAFTTRETDHLRCIDPGYKDFIPSDMIRRMGRIIKMGVTAAKLCLRDGNRGMPDAIITGTGLGCMEDTEKFLSSLILNNEEFLTPTSFIQSTHNTVAGQIALLIRCHHYNFTYVHRGISFESVLTDAMTQVGSGAFSSVLAGGTDELTTNYFTLTRRMGFWKQKPVDSHSLFADTTRGSIAGEGAAFFLLENKPGDHAYARLDGLTTFLRPASSCEISRRLDDFLALHDLTTADIGLVLLGMNGDPRSDEAYRALAGDRFSKVPIGGFKHLCGEYHTATSYAMWLAAMILHRGEIPREVLSGYLPGMPSSPPPGQDPPQKILIYNHFRNANHSIILLSRP